MKKNLIAIAVSGVFLTGLAHAADPVASGKDTNWQLYGVADIYVGKDSVGAPLATSAADKTHLGAGGLYGSRLGFKGWQEVSPGLKADFVYETGVSVDATAASSLGNRQSYVGLTGGFGQVRFGRQYTELDQITGAVSVDGNIRWEGSWGSFKIADTALSVSVAGTGAADDIIGPRVDNALTYRNTMGPVTIGVQHALGEAASNAVTSGVKTTAFTGDTTSFSAAFSQGDLNLVLGYATRGTSGVAATKAPGLNDAKDAVIVKSTDASTNSIDGYTLGGSYNLQVVKVFLGYSSATDKTTTYKAAAPAGTEIKTDITRTNLGVTIPVGADGSYALVQYAESAIKIDGASAKATTFTLGYNHQLGKNVNGYARFAQTGYDTDVKTATSLYGVGLRYSF